MHLPSRLRLSRHGIWYFRLVLPEDIAALLGQREIRRTLGTRCPQTAKHAAYRLSGRILPFLQKARLAMEFDPRSIDSKTIRELIAKGLKIDVKAGTIEAAHFETDPNPEVAKREMAALENLAKAMHEQQQHTLEAGDAKFLALVEGLGVKPKCENPTTIGKAIADFMETKKRLAESTKRVYEPRLKILATLLGGENRMLHEVSELDCVNALEKHQQSSPHAAKRKAGNITDDGDTRTATTIKDTLVLWEAFFKWAIKTRRYTGANPITDLPRPSNNTNDEAGAEPFTQEELKAIFQWAHFAEFKRPHQFWGPLIGLLMGMRCNEVAQLRIKDIVVEDGLKCFRMTHEPDADPASVLKNKASRRTLPIHPILWEIGLQDYLDDLAVIGAVRLFPNLPADPKTKKREKNLSRDFNEHYLRDKLGIWQRRCKVFHSFRDNVSSKLGRKHKQVNKAYKDDWLGHARDGVDEEHYDKKLSVREQAEMILPALDFGLDFSNFRYKKSQWTSYLISHSVP